MINTIKRDKEIILTTFPELRGPQSLNATFFSFWLVLTLAQVAEIFA